MTEGDVVSNGAEWTDHQVELSGRRVDLQPVTIDSYEWLYRLSVSAEVGWRWRWRASTPSPEAFARALWEDVLAQFVLIDRKTRQPLGLVQAYRADLVAGHAHLSAMLTPSAQRMGWPLEGMAIFIDYLFLNWGFNKLYAEVYDYNLDQFRRLEGLFVEEGVLRQHAKLGNRFSDLHIFALHAYTWAASGGGYGHTPLGFGPAKSLSSTLTQAFRTE